MSHFSVWGYAVSKRLALILISSAVFSVVENVHGIDLKEQAAASFLVPFDKLKALNLLYGELTPLKDGGHAQPAIWRNPKSIAEYWGSWPKDEAEVRVVFESPFKEDGVEKHIVITAAIPRGGVPYKCHACAPLIGGAIFRRIGNSWNVQTENKYITVLGKFGSTNEESIRLFEVGSNRYGVIFQGADVHQGAVSTYLSLLVPSKKTIAEVLHFFVEGPGRGACTDATLEQGIDIQPVKKGYATYYDIETTVRYNSGWCGRVKPVIETRYFTFNGGKYQRTK